MVVVADIAVEARVRAGQLIDQALGTSSRRFRYTVPRLTRGSPRTIRIRAPAPAGEPGHGLPQPAAAVAEGLVNELPGPHARFDGNLSEHHHFTCVPAAHQRRPARPATPFPRASAAGWPPRASFSLTHHRIEFYGRCLECQRRAGRGPRGAGAPRRSPGAPAPAPPPPQPPEEDSHGRQSLKGTKTHENLKDAFAGESQANRRYLYFARRRRHRGLPGRRRPVQGHRRRRDRSRVRSPRLPQAGRRPGHRRADRQHRARTSRPRSPARPTSTPQMYPGLAKTARDEGFDEIAEWFETLAKAEKTHAGRFRRASNQIAGQVTRRTLRYRGRWARAPGADARRDSIRPRREARWRCTSDDPLAPRLLRRCDQRGYRAATARSDICSDCRAVRAALPVVQGRCST